MRTIAAGFACLALGAVRFPLPVPAQAAVRGIVYDSVGRRALPGAHVQFVPVDPARHSDGRRTTLSDSTGGFAVANLEPGRYLVGFFHPRLDSLGLESPVKRIDFRTGRELTLELAVPSTESVIAGWCGPRATSDSTGVVLGYTQDPRGGTTWSDAYVTAQWRTITIGATGARAGVQSATTGSNSQGWFALCGVPRGGILVLRAAAGTDSSALLEVDVPDDGLLHRNIAFGRGVTAAGPAVRGFVRDVNGQPVAGARVRWWGADSETRADESGAFQLPSRSLGTAMLDVRMVGFVPTRHVIDVREDDATPVHVMLPDFPIDIDTVRVLARRPRTSEALGGFESRRRLGHGVFLDAESIERRRPIVFTDLLRSTPGVEVRPIDMMTRVIRMRSTNGLEACTPVVVIDGVRVNMPDMNLDDIVPADLVRAVEIYPRRMQAPPEFQGDVCGSIAIWTGLRGWLARQIPAAQRKTP